jgi:serine/threonine protein kinase
LFCAIILSMSKTLIGQTLAQRYRVTRLLAQGGFCRVYEAEHVNLQTRVAIKALHPEESPSQEAIERFHREAFIIGQLRHPCIVKAFDRGEAEDGSLWLAMEHVEGETLAARLRRGQLLSQGELLALLRPICEVLEEAHQKGIIHRDLNTTNIMLLPQPNQNILPKILDFGMASLKEAGELTEPDQVSGTPCYMSPEQWQSLSLADARSDIYSLGVICFEALSGKLPFEASSPVAWLKVHKSATLLSLSSAMGERSFSMEMEHIIAKALSKNPAERYQSAMAFGRALATVKAQEEVSTLPDLPWEDTLPSKEESVAVNTLSTLQAPTLPRLNKVEVVLATTTPAIPSQMGRASIRSLPLLPVVPHRPALINKPHSRLLMASSALLLVGSLIIWRVLASSSPEPTPESIVASPVAPQPKPLAESVPTSKTALADEPPQAPASLKASTSESKNWSKPKAPIAETPMIKAVTESKAPEPVLTEEFIKGTMNPWGRKKPASSYPSPTPSKVP